MTEKELLIQLNKLRSVAMAADVKSSRRALLLAQIAQGEEVSSLGYFARINVVMSRIFQPYAVAAMIVVFFAGSGVWGYAAANSAKPGDTLYTVKRLSEQTKLWLTFNDKSKAKLNLEFASRRALEISSLPQDQNTDSLKNDLKQEINAVKSHLATKVKAKPAASAADKSDQVESVKAAVNAKNNNKIDIAVPDKKISTSTSSLNDVLGEAEKLLNDDSYNEAADKLDQANQLIDQVK